VKDSSKVTRLNSQYFNLNLQFFESSMKMDEKFIAICTFRNESTKFCFFSKKTLDLLWQKTLKGNMKSDFVYGQGMLVLYVKPKTESVKFGLIEMYDVTSGRFIREMRNSVVGRDEDLKHRVGFNSKFMIITSEKRKISIYRLQTVKNRNSDPTLACVIEDDFIFFLALNESKIFGSRYTYNFGSFELFGNITKSVTLSLPWRSVWRSKGVDEEPLEPLHHMEAYREVLKYFYELSKNCQTDPKTIDLEKIDLATFTFGDDFIGYRQRRPKMIIFDENMDKSCHKMIYRSVQISKNTEVSVLGTSIHLIDIATGKVIKEKKLEREADEWHVNCNLLVCVHNIAEHKRLLSVWRIENSVNLTRIKDVTIGDYDGSVQVDKQFIAVETRSEENAETKTYNFISMKTFQVERSVSSWAKYLAYDKGYLFLQNKNLVRILDVSSGTFLRDIRMELDQSDSIICCANSNYVVLLSCIEYDNNNNNNNVFNLYSAFSINNR